MTNKEAIEELRQHYRVMSQCLTKTDCIKNNEAIDMAIKALSAEPCENTISRQQAIKAIKDLPDCANGFSDTYDKARIIAVLEDVPSVQTEISTCGDCKHYIRHDKRCGYWNHGVKPLEWCSHAERRTDERFDKQAGCD